eukprot:TRINITY_DN22424_c0_g1_i1.p1 TRINITY_DN22424_c0_g1~~TRINITY_DN22424_c0_g1_i1.p1  ORF type:complete len:362 (-),score=91.56 TRINITY_DN22424_c0_g1_i1:109-1194(-)
MEKEDKQPSKDQEQQEEKPGKAEIGEAEKELLSKISAWTIGSPPPPQEKKEITSKLSALTLEAVAEAIKSGKCKNIIVLTGAGISVAAGIPDFRSPGTGLYDNLQKYNLPHPQAIFEMDYFRSNPKPFFLLAKELFPGNYNPTPIHYFIKLLEQKSVLLRNYTQNIDTLEAVAGVSPDKVIEAHGSFATTKCIECAKAYSLEHCKKIIFDDDIPRCDCEDNGLIKPNIVFFGESLPSRFFDSLSVDFPLCDLLIVIGTSLQVQPFSSLIDHVGDDVPRLLINREVVGVSNPILMFLYGKSGAKGFDFQSGTRDIAKLGDCQEGVRDLVKLIGWESDFDALIAKGPAMSNSKEPETKPDEKQ